MGRLFSDILKEMRDGALDLECAQEFQNAMRAMKETGKPAKFTLTISAKPLQGGMVQLDDGIATKLPEGDRESTTYMYAGEDGELSKRDPRQPKLPTMGVVGRIERDGSDG